MDLHWSLDALYSSFESEEFKEDLEKCNTGILHIREWAEKSLDTKDHAVQKIEEYITTLNDFSHTLSKLILFAQLNLSTNAKDEKALQVIEQLETKSVELVQPEVLFQKWLGSLGNLDELIASSDLLKDHRFMLEQTAAKNKYLLSEKEEILLAKMQNTGSNAWSKLQELLTSTLLVDIVLDGKAQKLPLAVVRNLAYVKDANVRRIAYEAELAAYKNIEESSAACLNGIKGEAITVAEARGYASVLEKTLIDSRMDQETLDAMLEAIRESLPAFHKYYRKKGELLGHKNGLPFYDMFAPLGEVSMEYTYEEARAFIVDNFGRFSSKMAAFADCAFEEKWIDAKPREGKQGGAFCLNIHAIKQSRILANFTGSFNDVSTLAHELGHAYHGNCLMDQSYLNSRYPMPIAETASIFCETIITNAALESATDQEAFVILENDISGAGQVIVDIYSRFLFESELIKRRKNGSLSVNELKDMMLRAQKEAYGEGLDHQYLHPNMWTCKPHYYYGDLNFYNFPYAFGLLFTKGIYAEYLKRGSSFVDQYDDLLAVTGKMNIADVAKTMGIDVRSTEFWRSSLQLIEQDIEKFLSMA